MPKNKINKRIYQRCLLTEITPFETPLLFSNWGSFNYEYNLRNKGIKILNALFNSCKVCIPYTYNINKDSDDYRTLNIPHPGMSKDVVELYKNFDVIISKSCSKSSFSIRAPHNIARWFLIGRGQKITDYYIEQISENNIYASSYFVYKHFSHLYKFFESKQFSLLESRFSFMVRLDISKFFPSIYTHSISWALRGKNETKRLLFQHRKDKDSFSNFFDTLMQNLNYKETNGIIIGPELSRIFSEIILQTIDCSIQSSLQEENLKYNKDFFCCRYIDDYYFFYNNETILELFEQTLKIELAKYKLYLNPKKKEIMSRPFITQASLLKIELSKYLSDLSLRIREKRVIKTEKELNRLRMIIGNQKDNLNKVTNFFLGALNSSYNFNANFNECSDYKINLSLVYFELASHWYKLDTRVSGSYRIIEMTNKIIKRTKKLSDECISRVKSSLYFELIDILNIACNKKSILESLNILICLKILGLGYEVEDNVIRKLILAAQVKNAEDNIKRNTYFDIVTILYYIENNPQYIDSKKIILDSALSIITHNKITEYSETMLLFMDLLSCPYVEKCFKKKITEAVVDSIKISRNETDINTYISQISSYSWFFNWSDANNIKNLLKKKQFMLSY